MPMRIVSDKAPWRVYRQRDDVWYFEAAFVNCEDAKEWIHYHNGQYAPEHVIPYRIMRDGTIAFEETPEGITDNTIWEWETRNG